MNLIYFVSILRRLPNSIKKTILICFDFSVFILGSFLLSNSFDMTSQGIKLPNTFFIAPFFGIGLLGFIGIYNITSSESSINWLLPRVMLATFLTCIFSYVISQNNFELLNTLLYLVIVISCILLVRIISSRLWKYNSKGTSIAIYGAGEAGLRLSDVIKRSNNLNLIAFVDDNAALQGSLIGETKVISFEKLSLLVSSGKVEEIIIAIPSMRSEKVSAFMEKLAKFTIPISQCPSLSEMLRGSKINSLKSIYFDEFLGRSIVPPIQNLLEGSVRDKVILVTGAGGSIGSELCNKICNQQPLTLIILDHSEHALYELERSIRVDHPDINIIPRLMSILDEVNLERLFKELSPNIVFHAAAYKHVPLFEDNVRVGIKNNIFGTLNLVKICQSYLIEKFVLVSTDKAVRPTNVMGATKRICELIIQARAADMNKDETIFCMVRFGNVLGSSGSVVPLFKEQINMGGPVTVTSPEITRYFMSITEASELVLQASSLAEGGEVFVLDMGKPIKVIDLAKNMISRSSSNNEIQIEITGLRPGEKLYEELLVDSNAKATSHPKIMTANEPFIESKALDEKLKKLSIYLEKEDLDMVIDAMSDIVPDYEVNY